MKKIIRLTESQLKSVISRIINETSVEKGVGISEQKFLNEAEIPFPTGVSKQAIDKIMSISAQNRKGLRGSYLFPAQSAEIDKEFGQGTYQKFLTGGGQSVFDKKNTFIGTTKPQQTQSKQTQSKEIPFPTGLSKEAYNEIMSISAQNKKGLRGSYLFPAQASEIDKKYGQGTFKKFTDAGGYDVLSGKATFKISAPAAASVKGSTKEEYPECVKVFGNPVASQSGKQFSINGTGNWKDYFFFPNGYYGDRKITGTNPPHGKYACVGTTIRILPLDGETTPKTATSKTATSKDATSNTKTATKTTKSKVKYVKSNDLKDVKAFQDWLDANKSDEQLGQGKGWATGFPGGKLNKGKGYGKYGPRSNAAWEKYGNEYGQIKSLTLAPEVQSKIDAQNNLMYGPQTDIQGNPVNPQISRPS